MGLLDKMKAMKNAVTGGAAKVFLDCEAISLSEPFTITVRAQTGDAPVKIDRVYLNLKGFEEVEVPDIDVVYDEEGDANPRRETVRASNKTVNLQLTVSQAQELAANTAYEWQTQVELPVNSPNIYKGRFCQHTYTAMAGLDCFGNDPDSGWIELHE